MRDDALADAISADFESAPIDGRQKAMLSYVRKLTLTPKDVRNEDVLGLRDVGFEDEEILAIVEVAAYYAYVNRIADGLGVRLEESASPR